MMTVSRHTLLFLGLLGPMYLITSQLCQQGLSPWRRNKERRLHHIQEMRKANLEEMCKLYKKEASEGKQSLEKKSQRELKNLVVDENHGIIYCYIPKVACTNWKRVMVVLNQSEPYTDPISVPPDLVHTPHALTLLSSFPKSEMKVKLKHYTKFLFVRHPFIRLISAYRDKFQRNNKYFYMHFGRTILRLYGNKSDPPISSDEAFALGIRPSFYNFIQYLLDPQTEEKMPFEPHWRQMHRMCHPCLIEYDFIGLQETLQEDAEHLLRNLHLENEIKFPPSYENMTSRFRMAEWFQTVPLEDRRKLYSLYKKDFELFGYETPNELLDG